MAEQPKKVTVKSSRIDASILPSVFSLPYRLYVMQQTSDLQDLANSSNNANDIAYQATIKNEDQDAELQNHEQRISDLRVEVDEHEVRITANSGRIAEVELRLTSAEGEITTIKADISGIKTRLTGAENAITAIQGDYISKTITSSQSLASSLNVASSYAVNGVKVVGPRVTGWTAATGTSYRGAFNANASMPVSATYTQSEVQAISNNLLATIQRLKGLEDAVRAHGLIDG
ncbi:phage tail protein [Franconibacter sp. IITDAS19]|uniref:phage tail protein n=1 Tax=Franconibacter sp. IITDAS19 TaxID=2930569 RepID=UPI001FF73271|nr:phage tail protein [Franconibacter sp. IITDAS19]MCK1966870.1 phage tail protein [Franconibacter sp. IITDAS19]